jgi:hypothetical protein
MDKENVIDIKNGVLFSLKEKGNPTICENMNEFGEHYVR